MGETRCGSLTLASMTANDDSHSGVLVAWNAHQRAARRSGETIGLRAYQLRRLQADVKRPLLELDTGDLIAWMAAHEWSRNTARSYAATLKAFYGWAWSTGRIEANPALKLPAVPAVVGRPRPTPEHALLQALATADPRVRLMIRLAAQAGLRRAEISRVHTSDILDGGVDGGHVLRVRGKGDKVRVVPLNAGLAAELRALPAGWVFPSPASGHLTPAHVGKLIARQLPDRWTTHTLRHRFASAAYQVDRDLRAVQELLGHTKPETTAIYTAVPGGAKRRAIDMIA